MHPAMEITITKIIHLLAMGIWVGAGLTAPFDVRRTIRLGKPHTDPLLDRLRLTVRILISAGVVTVATGLALVFLKGGFKAVSPRIHVGMLLSLIALAVGCVGVVPALRGLGHALASGDEARARALGLRFEIATWSEEMLRLIVLALMVGAGK